MKLLYKDELLNIKGGSLNFSVYASIIAAAVSFVVGFFDGLARPFGCR